MTDAVLNLTETERLRRREKDLESEVARLQILLQAASKTELTRQALLVQQEELDLVTRAARLGRFDYRPRDGKLTWNNRCRELFGVSPDRPVTYEGTFLAALHPSDRVRAEAAVAAAFEPAGNRTFEVEYRTIGIEDGIERHVLAMGLAFIEDDVPVRLIGAVLDMTGERRAQALTVETLERLRLATRATQDAIWDWDLVNDHVVWNEAIHSVYGYARDAVGDDGAWWLDKIHPADRDRIAHGIHAVIDGGGTDWRDSYRFRRADGSFAEVDDRGSLIRDAAGRGQRMIGAMLDQSEVRELLRRSQTFASTLAEEVTDRTAERDRLWATTNDLMGTAGLDGYLKCVNPAWTKMLGWSEAEILDRPFVDLIDPADHAETADVVGRLARGETISGFVDRVLKKDGTQRTIEWTAVPDPGTTLFYIVGRDLTDQRLAEEALRQSQKMEAVGQLTGGLAHDFNNLLAGISGSLELMNTRLSQGRLKDVERYMAAAQGAARRAAALTHRLLAFSRRQTLAPKPTDINRLITGMADLVRRTVGPSIAVEVVGVSGLWTALVDPPQLENALLNLCINARDAMPTGGRITIETANKWLDRAASRTHDVPEGQYLSLCVTDTGVGMPPDVIEKAFEPFFTTKPLGEGTGLGLSMIYGFAKQSGGHVRIYSEVDQGTTVCIYLPRHLGAADEADPRESREATPRAQQGETVLIVDDEPTVRMLVADVLDELGYTAIEAADSVAGLKVLQSGVRIDLLVTDVGLPGGMNGRQMADAARATRPKLKVLFITGYAENALLGNGQLERDMAVLTKPFAVETLGIRIREMIAG